MSQRSGEPAGAFFGGATEVSTRDRDQTAPVAEGPGVTRRDMFKTVGLGAAAAAAATGGLFAGLSLPAPAQAASLNMKKIARTGAMVPAVGMGTFMTFDKKPGASRGHLKEVLKRFYDGGGRVIDTSPLYGMSEVNIGHFATALDVTDKLVICNKIWSTGEYLSDDSHAVRSLNQSMARLWRNKIDVMQCHSLVNVPIIVSLMKDWKKDGLIGAFGVTHHELPYFGALAGWVEKGELDYVQVHYSIQFREAEKRILPAALEKGTAVLVNMPFEKARLFELVKGRPLPDFAKDFADNWAQFFLKWVISHPAVTAAIPATSNPDHASENIGALKGPLPDEKMRARMVKYMEEIPGFADLQKAKAYPGKNYDGVVRRPGASKRA